jgi:hypothetical protein
MKMDNTRLPAKMESKKRPLWNDILDFNKHKYLTAGILAAVGLLGIVIPIIPGIALFIMAVALFKKGWMKKIRTKIKLWKIK